MLTVGAVVREPLKTTLGFVSWYLEQGADRIILCFDDVHDPAIDHLDPIPEVTCVRATPDFLKSIGMHRGRRFVRRQNMTVQKFYEDLDRGWFLHVDGDELLYLEGRTIAEELIATPGETRGVTFLPAEHLRTPDDDRRSHFRLIMTRPQLRQVYGPDKTLFRRRSGLTGHKEGKTATRAGLGGVHMRQHFMHYADGSLAVDRSLGAAEGAYLLHFVDQGYDLWRSKLDWRLTGRGFSGHLAEKLRSILELGEPEPELKALYDTLHVFGPERRARLEEAGALLSLDLGLDALTGRYFPGVDFSRTSESRYAA